MNFFASYINCLRSVWAPVGFISLAIAHEKDNVPRFLYLRIAQALIHNWCRWIRWLRFDDYSGKIAYRPIGQRGDPLKILLYRIFIDIARESEPTVPCTCWVRAVAVLSAISAKSSTSKLYVLRLPPAGCKVTIQKYRHAQLRFFHIHGYRDTGIPGYRDTGIQGYGDTGIQGYSDTGMQGCMIP